MSREREEKPDVPEAVRAYFSALGKRSRETLMERTTPEWRRKRARKAIKARWAEYYRRQREAEG